MVTEKAMANDKLHEECGVFGIYSHKDDVALNTYWGLYALQHRGQESAGIAVTDGKNMNIKKGMGLVANVFHDGIAGLEGHIGLGHVRYSTTGASIAYNVQPLKVYYDGGNLALAHNGNLTNAAELRSKLTKSGVVFQTTVDTELVLSLVARSRKATLPERVAEAANQIEGAFAIIIMNDEELVAFRDPYGFRPMCLGRLDNGWVVTSETCALDLVGAKYVRDIKPGEMIVIKDDYAEPESFMYADKMPDRCAHCIFEYVYFARPDSIIDKESVYLARVNMGRQLARETKNIDADLVISVPDSGTPAAIGYGLEKGIPFLEGLTKNKYIGRTFIQPTQKQRLNAVKLKLNANRALVEGKNVVMVDDSIVRGTTSGKIVQLLKDAGAKSVHVCISSPPVKFPCYYGIDTSARKELIASTKTEAEIQEYIKADSLHYISMEGLRKSLSVLNPDGMCYACFNGDYPDGADKVIRQGTKYLFETKC
ncbi:MAG: amidophosphoribosyltransferase [Acidaminococcaceae bacterium]|nr:amidophosphoribosyltransferase [Acidaminococcaceae bacterium]MCI2109613.1 amidophosphoribosyltransferase [Acidaminococcaceae bacterium]